MSEREGKARSGRRGASLAVGLVGVLAGLLFATNASLFDDGTHRRPTDLEDLVRAESERLEATNAEVVELRTEVDALLQRRSAGMPEADPTLTFAAGRTAVHGPGLEVRLWDSPLVRDIPEGYTGDDLVVHQQDIEAVINAMWAGGAEAVSVQGHRLTATSSVRCVGNVLLVDGNTYSPPYEVAAIGDADLLRGALDASDPVRIYRQYVDAVRLGWSVDERDDVTMPADEGNLGMRYARVPGEQPVTVSSNAVRPGEPL